MEKGTFLGFFDYFKSVFVGTFSPKTVKNSCIGWNKALDGHPAFYRAQNLRKIGQKLSKIPSVERLQYHFPSLWNEPAALRTVAECSTFTLRPLHKKYEIQSSGEPIPCSFFSHRFHSKMRVRHATQSKHGRYWTWSIHRVPTGNLQTCEFIF